MCFAAEVSGGIKDEQENKKGDGMIISTHSHLCANPEDLDRIVGSKMFEQVWLLHTYYARDKKLPREPYARATGDEILSVCREYRGFFCSVWKS